MRTLHSKAGSVTLVLRWGRGWDEGGGWETVITEGSGLSPNSNGPKTQEWKLVVGRQVGLVSLLLTAVSSESLLSACVSPAAALAGTAQSGGSGGEQDPGPRPGVRGPGSSERLARWADCAGDLPSAAPDPGVLSPKTRERTAEPLPHRSRGLMSSSNMSQAHSVRGGRLQKTA